MADSISAKEEYARITCLFLAEQLRIRKIKIKRVGEIAEKVAAHINLINNEKDFAALIKELSKDFEELLALDERLHWRMEADQRIRQEQWVKEFVIQILPSDPALALNIAQEAAKTGEELDALCAKFPRFKQFIETKNDYLTRT